MATGLVQTSMGDTAQWVVFACMAITAVAFAIAVQFRPTGLKLPYYINIAICTIAATAYYAMAVAEAGDWPTNDSRQVTYARYLDWIFTTPLLLLDLILMTNMPSAMISWIMGADVFMIVFGIIGALDDGNTKWVYFVAGCVMQLALTWGMVNPIFKEELKKSKEYTSGYSTLLIYLIIVWVCYPIVWGLGAGGRILDVDGEIIAMCVLDLLAKPLFGVGVLIVHEVVYSKLEKEVSAPLNA
eukprot:TRINITY_DN1520_c0_g1_i1.p3 TRINITY_DN1520_c0_g1~~TRINITY_DN1520_c0_g1_i1.p3  ORF type:complete len:242 (+),score=35.30 TRINITY_DN1520_c0_g1_i1:135-860(+)